MEMTNDDQFDFPYELCCKPSTLIGIAGLDIVKNSVHRYVWDSFNKGQSRLSLKFKLIMPQQKFPQIKSKKTSYERYIPKGILKKNWMNKHLTEIPAVVAIFFDLNWDDPNWEQKKIECINYFQSIESLLGALSSKKALILIQRAAPLPPAEDIRSAERSNSLCTACGLPTRQLFVLPQGESLQGCILRLENTIFDLSKAYFTQEIKYIKLHKDLLNKTIHRFLFVRHNFKMGYLSELKQDYRGAKSFYEAAYTCLRDIRIVDTNAMELKVVAGFINYKLCHLMFALAEPRDAISQFRNHIELYRAYMGPPELLFEHYAWLSKQYSAFADIFDEAIKHGLSGTQTEHPGFYYKQAAIYACDRKKVAETLTTGALEYPQPDPLAAEESLEFWGQRPWRAGKLSAEPIDLTLEKSAVAALQYRERLVDHSGPVIKLLGNAVSQFKTFRCKRHRLQLLVQMAVEYYSSRDYGKALTVLSHTLWDYRREKWWRLLSNLLSLAICCAYLSANISDYVIFAIEYLHPDINYDLNARKRILNNIKAILKMELPEPEPTIPEDKTIQALWKEKLSPCHLTLDLESIKSPLHIQASFNQAKFIADQELISVSVFLNSICPGSISISKVSVILTSCGLSSEHSLNTNEIVLDEEVPQTVTSSIDSRLFRTGKDIAISNVLLTLGNQSGISVTLKYSQTTKDLNSNYNLLRSMKSHMLAIERASLVPKASLVSLSVTSESPSLIGEQLAITITVSNNNEANAIYQPVLDVKLTSGNDEQSTKLSDSNQATTNPRTLKISLEDIKAKESREIVIYMMSYSAGERSLTFSMTFYNNVETEHGNKNAEAIEEIRVIPVIKPFEVTTEIMSMKFDSLTRCYAHEKFLLCPSVEILSPAALTIRHSSLELGLLVNSCDKTITSRLAGLTLSQYEIGRDIFPLIITESKEQPIALGTYVIQWSRNGSDQVTSSSITMPAVQCEKALLTVEVDLPAHGKVRQPMSIEYRFFNRTATLLQMDLVIDGSDAFLFAGQKQTLLRILPNSERKLQYQLFTLMSGLVALPRLSLTATDLSEQFAAILERSLPTHIYVMPPERKFESDDEVLGPAL